MRRSVQRILQCVMIVIAASCISAGRIASQDVPAAAHSESADLKATIKSVNLGDWRYDGFETIDGTDGHRAPWSPFINAKKGYVADFINPSKDLQNTGKGGNAEGTRHPQFSLWIFPKTADNTPERFEETISAHQMVQSSIPTVIGAGKTYVLACVGDIDEAQSQVSKLAKAFKVPGRGGH